MCVLYSSSLKSKGWLNVNCIVGVGQSSFGKRFWEGGDKIIDCGPLGFVVLATFDERRRTLSWNWRCVLLYK